MLATVATTMYGVLSNLQWNSFYFPSWDLGIFSSLIQQYAHLQPPEVWIKGDHYNLLGDHFHPLLITLAPLWWLWPSPLALLWAQAALIGISSIPLTRYAMRTLGTTLGTVAGVSYALSFGLQATQNVQFHEYALAVPLLAFGVVALLNRQATAAALWLAPLVFVKEDLGLTVAALGVIGAWMLRDTRLDTLLPPRERYDPPYLTRAWLTALPGALHPRLLALACWGAAWFPLATFVILPLLSPENSYEYTDNFASLTSLMVPLDKWITLGLFAAFMGVIGLRSPLALALIPTFTWRFLGNVEFYWTWQWHYNAILMPIAFGALLYALSPTAASAPAPVTATAPASATASAPAGSEPVEQPTLAQAGPKAVAKPALPAPAQPRERAAQPAGIQRVIRLGAVGLSLLSTATFLGALPLTWIFTGRFEPDSAYANQARGAVAQVPAGSSVAADITLLAPLVPGRSVQWLHSDTRRAPECVAAKVTEPTLEWAPRGLSAWANEKWPVTRTPRVEQINGGPVTTSARAPYQTLYRSEFFEVACQGDEGGL